MSRYVAILFLAALLALPAAVGAVSYTEVIVETTILNCCTHPYVNDLPANWSVEDAGGPTFTRTETRTDDALIVDMVEMHSLLISGQGHGAVSTIWEWYVHFVGLEDNGSQVHGSLSGPGMERAEFFADSPNGGYFPLSTGRFYTNPDRALFSFELATRIISPRIDGAPVPEPSTFLLLLGACLAGLPFVRALRWR